MYMYICVHVMFLQDFNCMYCMYVDRPAAGLLRAESNPQIVHLRGDESGLSGGRNTAVLHRLPARC